MILRPLDILVFKGYWFNPVTHIIFTRTSSFYTHCAIYIGDGVLIEAVASGVKETALAHYHSRSYKVMRYRHEIHPDHVQEALTWLYDQVEMAMGYDFLALLGFLTGWYGFSEENKFFCSELVAYCFQAAKIDLWNEIPVFMYPCEFIRHHDFAEVKG